MRLRYHKGFTLVEMAVVIMVFGLLLAIGFKMLIPLTDRIKQTRANQIVDAAKESIVGFAQTNTRLPTVDEFKEIAKNSQDVWGKDLVYRPDERLLDAGSICSLGTTGTTVNVCADSACTDLLDTAVNTAFFILSSGANMNIQTLVDMTGAASATINTFTEDLAGIDKDTSDMNRPEAYKDIAKWVVLPELRVQLGCEGPPLRILDTPIPSGVEEKGYEADIFATGGVPWPDASVGPPPVSDEDITPDFEWCVTGDLPMGLTYECNGTLAVSAACTLSLGTWQRCSFIHIEGTPSEGGSFYLPVFVRDSYDAIDDQAFAMSIASTSGLNVCTEYRVWNRTPGGGRGFMVRQGYDVVLDPVLEACMDLAVDNEIVFPARVGPPPYTIRQYEVLELYTAGGGCGGLDSRLSFNNAILADTNGDCCVNLDHSLFNNQAYDAVCP